MCDTFISNFAADLLNHFDGDQVKLITELLRIHCQSYEIKPIQICTDPEDYQLPEEYFMFMAAKEQDGRLSEKSKRQYELCLRSLLMDLRLPLKDISVQHIRMHLQKIGTKKDGTPLSISSLNQRKSIIRSFFKWLYEEEYIMKDPSLRVRVDRHKPKPTEAFHDTDIEKLRNNCDCIRDKAIVDLLVCSGIRISELVGLNKEDIDLQNRTLLVYGKGGKWRKSYIDGRCAVSIKDYLESREDDHEALFVSIRKPYRRLETDAIRRMLKLLGKKSGIADVHPHRFRHTMATDAVNHGMPVESIQRILGHSAIETTMRYAHVSEDKIKNDHHKYVS